MNYLKILQVILLWSMTLAEAKDEDKGIQFNRTYVGVVFSPYTRYYDEELNSYPSWNASVYGKEEMKVMVQVMSTKFTEVGTYGVGALENFDWDKGFSIGMTSVVAAEINRDAGEQSIQVLQGIWRSEGSKLNDSGLQYEVNTSFFIAEMANEIFHGTVKGLIFSSEYVKNDATAIEIREMIDMYRDKAKNLNLEVGFRSGLCESVIQTERPEASSNGIIRDQNADYILKDLEAKHFLVKLVLQVDFIVCYQLPFSSIVENSMPLAVSIMGKRLERINKIFTSANPKLKVIFETGWPSGGVSDNNSKNTVRNLQDFWIEMGKWAVKNQIKIHMHEAFDNPWKIRRSTNSEEDAADTTVNGPRGSASSYGWWKRVSNDDIYSYQEKVPETEPKNYTIPIVITAVIAVLCIIGYLSWRLYTAKAVIEKLTDAEIKEFQYGLVNPNADERIDVAWCLPYDRSYEISDSDFEIDNERVLGKGISGTVFTGKLTGNPQLVAIKTPNRNADGNYLRGLLSEIKVMIYIGKHNHIVSILGAYTEKIRSGIIYIFSEYCPMGSLESHLRSIPAEYTPASSTNNPRYVNDLSSNEQENVNVPLSPHYTNVLNPNLIKWCYEIAVGMDYLAEKKVIHADLATRNVLLNDVGIAKITDFGLSRRLYEYTNYVKTNQEPMPWRWMAIESLRNLSFSTQSDVWAYGVTVWEIFSLADIPYPGLSWNMSFVGELENGLKLQKPKYSSDDIYEEISRCWNLNPKERPEFSDLAIFFNKLRTVQLEFGK